jgi:hypothetical protein
MREVGPEERGGLGEGEEGVVNLGKGTVRGGGADPAGDEKGFREEGVEGVGEVKELRGDGGPVEFCVDVVGGGGRRGLEMRQERVECIAER